MKKIIAAAVMAALTIGVKAQNTEKVYTNANGFSYLDSRGTVAEQQKNRRNTVVSREIYEIAFDGFIKEDGSFYPVSVKDTLTNAVMRKNMTGPKLGALGEVYFMNGDLAWITGLEFHYDSRYFDLSLFGGPCMWKENKSSFYAGRNRLSIAGGGKALVNVDVTPKGTPANPKMAWQIIFQFGVRLMWIRQEFNDPRAPEITIDGEKIDLQVDNPYNIRGYSFHPAVEAGAEFTLSSVLALGVHGWMSPLTNQYWEGGAKNALSYGGGLNLKINLSREHKEAPTIIEQAAALERAQAQWMQDHPEVYQNYYKPAK